MIGILCVHIMIFEFQSFAKKLQFAKYAQCRRFDQEDSENFMHKVCKQRLCLLDITHKYMFIILNNSQTTNKNYIISGSNAHVQRFSSQILKLQLSDHELGFRKKSKNAKET